MNIEDYNSALSLRKAGRDDEALEHLNRLLTDAPKYSPGLLMRAELFIDRDAWQEAGSDLDAIIEIGMPTAEGPSAEAMVHLEFARALATRAQVRKNLDNPDGARQDLEQAGGLLTAEVTTGPPWLRQDYNELRDWIRSKLD